MRTTVFPTQPQLHDLAAHFLALDAGDRFLRFGWAITDSQILAYVGSLPAVGDCVFVVVESDGDISGVLHLESMGCGVTVGLTVSAWARKMGIGTLLLQQAGEVARAQGLRTLFVRNLNLNTQLRRLARHLGMSVACAPESIATGLQVAGGERYRSGSFRKELTLADDSLRPNWSGASAGTSLLALPQPVLSNS